MKSFEWNEEKNAWLKQKREISFEEIVFAIENGALIDTYVHPNQDRYSGQSVFVVNTNDYFYLVPFVEEDEYYFLKAIIPSRQAKKQYSK